MAPPPRLAVATGDLALGCLAEASSVKSTERIAANAVDGNSATRWTSSYKDDQWLSLDLEAAHAVSRVHIKWEKAFAKSYDLEGSLDGSAWRPLAQEKGQEGWVETALPGRGAEVRHLRIACRRRATEYGFSIWHVQVLGTTPSHWGQLERAVRRADRLPYAALPSTPLRMLPALLGRQLKWYTWNAIAHAARLRFAEKCASRMRRENLTRAGEDEHRREEHLRAVRSAGVLASATLSQLQAKLEVCGASAADAALAGRPLESLPPQAAVLAPAELDEGLWHGILGSVLFACRAMAEALMDAASPDQGYEPYSHKDKSRQLQADFERDWQSFFRAAAADGSFAEPPRARCAFATSSAAPGAAATPASPGGAPELSHAGWQVLWMIWNELWLAANLECSRCSRLSTSRREKRRHRAEEDAIRSGDHLAQAVEAGVLDMEILLDIRWHACAAGRAAALPDWGGAPAAARAEDTTGSARGWSPAFQSLLEEVLQLGASAVKEMLAGELDSGDEGGRPSDEARVRRARGLQGDFERRWRDAFQALLESSADGQGAAGAAHPAAPAAPPSATAGSRSSASEQCREAMWLVWNETWFGANDGFAHSLAAEAGGRAAKLEKARENRSQGERHLQAALEAPLLPADVLEHLRLQARAAGRAAAHRAVQGEALVGRQFEVRAPPGSMPAATWELALDSLVAAAASVAEMLLDEYTPPPRQTPEHKFRSRWLQAEFERSWHCLYDPPYREAPRAQGLSKVPALADEQFSILPQSAVDEYLHKGFLGPLQGLAEAEVQECHRGFRGYDYGSHSVGSPRGAFLGHALLPWLWDLACHPRILSAVAAVLRTSTVLLYQSLLISRSPGKSGKEETGVDWHADGGGFRNIGPLDDFVTVFLALTPSTWRSGGLEFVPQRAGGGAAPAAEGRTAPAVLELQAGEFSLHSASVNHRAVRNVTRQRRDCIIFRYISGRVRDLVAHVHEKSQRDFALLCCGHDGEGHFHPVPRPVVSEGEEEVALWHRIVRLRKQRGPLA